jgi:response regulator of citrate/malate metabolism
MLIEKKRPSIGDVLIADADASTCELLQDYCKKTGRFRNILCSNDGALASSKMRNQKFALIILDLKLPKKSGLDLIRELSDKSTNHKNSVLIISDVLDKTMYEKIIAAGVTFFLSKPLDEAVFQEKILNLIKSK